MPALAPVLRRLLPDGADVWLPVTAGESGATVLHDASGARYAKLATGPAAADLAAERERLLWLAQVGIPTAAVLSWQSSGGAACLITAAVPGTPAHELDAAALRTAWPGILEAVRQLHALPRAGCRFARGLDMMMPIARATVAADRVQTAFLPEDLQGVDPMLILQAVEEELPQREREEAREAVVCHGDLCLPNLLIGADGRHVTGLIDVSRLGVADPYADLALLLATAGETWGDGPDARAAEAELEAALGIALDPERLGFHRMLDPLTWPR